MLCRRRPALRAQKIFCHILAAGAYNAMMRTELILKDCGANPLGLYVVREGDTAQSVCAAFGIPPALLIAENKLKEFPPAGSMLVLPLAAKTYVVQAGDTVESICRKFGIGEGEFLRLNGCSYVFPTQRVCVEPRGR